MSDARAYTVEMKRATKEDALPAPKEDFAPASNPAVAQSQADQTGPEAASPEMSWMDRRRARKAAQANEMGPSTDPNAATREGEAGDEATTAEAEHEAAPEAGPLVSQAPEAAPAQDPAAEKEEAEKEEAAPEAQAELDASEAADPAPQEQEMSPEEGKAPAPEAQEAATTQDEALAPEAAQQDEAEKVEAAAEAPQAAQGQEEQGEGAPEQQEQGQQGAPEGAQVEAQEGGGEAAQGEELQGEEEQGQEEGAQEEGAQEEQADAAGEGGDKAATEKADAAPAEKEAPAKEGGAKKGGDKAGAEGAKESGSAAAGAGLGGPTLAPQPVAAGAGGSGAELMAQFMEQHKADPEPTLALTGENDRIGRHADALGAKIPKELWADAIPGIGGDISKMIRAWKSNPFKDSKDVVGKILAVLHYIGPAVDMGISIAGKVGMAATIGGAILTLLAPPVGAFLLAAGRVANAVSTVLSAVRLIISVVSSVLTAVKIGLEPNPQARLELVQHLRQDISAGVGAGLTVVLSKLGGGAKNAGKTATSRASDAMKTAWKQGSGMGKVTGAIAAGARTFKQSLGTSMREGVQGLKNMPGQTLKSLKGGIASIRQAGFGGTMANLGHGIKSGLHGKFVAPITDSLASFQVAKASWQSWQGGANIFSSQYWKAVGSVNFPTVATAQGIGGKAKAVYSSLTDANVNGYMANVQGVTGAAWDKDNPGQVTDPVAKQRKKTADLQAALDGGDRTEMLRAMHGPEADLDKFSHFSDDTVRHQVKLQATDSAQKLRAINYTGAGMGAAEAAFTPGASVVKSAVAGSGGAGATISKGMSGQSAAEVKKGQKNSIQDFASQALETKDKKERSFVKARFQPANASGRVESFFAGIPADFDAHIAELQADLIARTGGQASVTLGAAGNAAAKKVEPPPPAPPEGITIPGEEELGMIAQSRAEIPGLKGRIEEDIAAALTARGEAEKALAKAQEASQQLAEHSATAQEQQGANDKDLAQILSAKENQALADAKLDEGQGQTDGAQSEAAGVQQQGAGTDVVADEGKKKAEEEKKAREDQAAWDAEYKSASLAKKAWMKGKKAVMNFANFLKKAVDFVWKTLIKPAIEAVKKAMAKVMGFITELITQVVLKIVAKIMGGKAEGRINETLAAMKEAQAQETQQETAAAQAEAQETKGKASEAEEKATAEIARCDENAAEGQALIAQLDQNDAALAAREAQIRGERDAFKAQYGPYFDWKANQENEEKKGPAEGEELQDAPQAQEEPAAQQDLSQQPLPPSTLGLLAQAVQSVGGDSQSAEQELKALTKAHADAFLAQAPEAEKAKLSAHAQQVISSVLAQQGANETERRTRLAGYRARIAALSSMRGADAVKEVVELRRAIVEDAKGVDAMKSATIDAFNESFSQA